MRAPRMMPLPSPFPTHCLHATAAPNPVEGRQWHAFKTSIYTPPPSGKLAGSGTHALLCGLPPPHLHRPSLHAPPQPLPPPCFPACLLSQLANDLEPVVDLMSELPENHQRYWGHDPGLSINETLAALTEVSVRVVVEVKLVGFHGEG